MVKEFADSTPGIGESCDVLFAKSRFRREVLGSISEPGESIPLSDDAVGKLDGCFAMRSYIR